jgi:hypothetical protein
VAVLDRRLGAGPGSFALLLHQRLEAGVVHRQSLFGEQLPREVIREAVGVVQLEGVLGVDPRGALLIGLGDQLREQFRSPIEGAPEALLLVPDPAQDGLALGLQVWIDPRQQRDRLVGKAVQVGRLQPEDPPLLDRPAHDPPQDVAAFLVRGDDAVGDQVDHPPRVVGEDPHRARRLAALLVRAPRELFGELHQGAEEVGLVHRGDVLEDRGHPLEAQASVDVSLRQVGERAVLVQLVRHEHVVPVLEVALGVVAGALVLAAELRPAVEIHLRARPARPDRARLPEVLRTRQQNDPLLRHAVRLPELDRLGVGAEGELGVAREHGDPDPLRVEPETVEGQLPAEADRLLLEVIAEAEVAEHLEEGEVAGGLSDLVHVGGPKAALAGGEAGGGRLLLAEEVGLQRLHPRGGQKDGWVIRGGHQRCRRQPQVLPALEVGQERLPDLARLHGDRSLRGDRRLPDDELAVHQAGDLARGDAVSGLVEIELELPVAAGGDGVADLARDRL